MNKYLHEDQRDVLVGLSEAKARFLIIGGFAFSAHAFIRATKDIDIWIDPANENARLVWQALAKYGAPLTAHDISPDDFQTLELVYQMGLPPSRIDILTSVSNIDFQEAWDERVISQLDGIQVPILSLRHLIQAKQSAARKQDLLDLESLKQLEKDE